MFGFQYSPPVISSIRLENLELSAQSASDAAASALGEVQALFDQVLQYRNESQYYYTQVQQIQEGDYVTTQSLTDKLGAFAFSDLQNIPTTFPPDSHNHHWNGISGKPPVFPPDSHRHSWSDLDDKPAEFEPAEHVHSWLQIDGKPATFPPEMHYHDWASIQNKPASFNPAVHSHSWGDITGKPSSFTPAVHSHDWGAITGKPTTFNPAGHTHNWSDLRNLPANFDAYVTAAGVRDKLKTVDGAGSGVDADLLDGQHGNFYRNASNLNAGTVSDARLNRSYSYNSTGYSRIPGGFIVQWGTVSVSDKQEVTFPTAFPNACMGVTGSSVYSGDGDTLISKFGAADWNRTKFMARRSGSAAAVFYVAVGF